MVSGCGGEVMAAGAEATGCILSAARKRGLALFGAQLLSLSNLSHDPSPWNGAAHIQDGSPTQISLT